MWKLKKTQFWTTNGSKKKSNGKQKKILNENGNITYPKLWNAAKAPLRRKFITINNYIKREERSQKSDFKPQGIIKNKLSPK